MKRMYLAVTLCALALAPFAKADIVYTFTMDTAPLVGNGQFTVDLQFLQGSGVPGDIGNNTIQFTDFNFGGGSPSGGGTATGGASGSLATVVTLSDTEFFNEYYENFTPGGQLSFGIDTTNVPDPQGTPDLLTLAILDGNGDELPTTGFSDEFLDVSLTGGAAPQVSTFGSAPGGDFSLAAPEVQSQSEVPEPGGLGLLSVLLLAGFYIRNRRIEAVAGAADSSVPNDPAVREVEGWILGMRISSEPTAVKRDSSAYFASADVLPARSASAFAQAWRTLAVSISRSSSSFVVTINDSCGIRAPGARHLGLANLPALARFKEPPLPDRRV